MLRVVSAALVTVVTATFAAPALAQFETSSLLGTVRDQSGAPVPRHFPVPPALHQHDKLCVEPALHGCGRRRMAGVGHQQPLHWRARDLQLQPGGSLPSLGDNSRIFAARTTIGRISSAIHWCRRTSGRCRTGSIGTQWSFRPIPASRSGMRRATAFAPHSSGRSIWPSSSGCRSAGRQPSNCVRSSSTSSIERTSARRMPTAARGIWNDYTDLRSSSGTARRESFVLSLSAISSRNNVGEVFRKTPRYRRDGSS